MSSAAKKLVIVHNDEPAQAPEQTFEVIGRFEPLEVLTVAAAAAMSDIGRAGDVDDDAERDDEMGSAMAVETAREREIETETEVEIDMTVQRIDVVETAAADSEAEPAQRPEELRLLEALLFAAAEPLDEATLARSLPDGVEIKQALAMLKAEYATRGVNLVKIGRKWTFRTADDLAWLLTKQVTETRKLSRAAIETLAIIAYHQPVTRAEIEEVRGVATAAGTLDVLLKTGWIRPRGRRKAPGRPITYGTNEAFLSHFGLEEVGDLPGLDELKGAGLLEGNMPTGFAVPMPSDDATLRDDEDPLEPGDLDFGLAPAPEAEAKSEAAATAEAVAEMEAEAVADARAAAEPDGDDGDK